MALQEFLCRLLVLCFVLCLPVAASPPAPEDGEAGGLPLQELNPQIDPATYRRACPDYTNYARSAQ